MKGWNERHVYMRHQRAPQKQRRGGRVLVGANRRRTPAALSHGTGAPKEVVQLWTSSASCSIDSMPLGVSWSGQHTLIYVHLLLPQQPWHEGTCIVPVCMNVNVSSVFGVEPLQ